MSRIEIYQRYVFKNLVCKIKEDKEVYQNLKKEGKNVYCALTFIIKEIKSKEIISRYTYMFIDQIEVNEINEFIKNFLEDPKFRNEKAILEEGDACNYVFKFSDEGGINLQCKSFIDKLNKQNIVDEGELEQLRTIGIDRYSKMDFETIEELIDPLVVNRFIKELKKQSLVIKACRWYARGLREDLAIIKARIEYRIIKNKRSA